MVVCGQCFDTALLNRVHETIQRQPRLSRRALSRQLRQWLDWKSLNGRLKEMSARTALLRLHRQGHLRLPRARRGPPPRRVPPPLPSVPVVRGAEPGLAQ